MSMSRFFAENPFKKSFKKSSKSNYILRIPPKSHLRRFFQEFLHIENSSRIPPGNPLKDPTGILSWFIQEFLQGLFEKLYYRFLQKIFRRFLKLSLDEVLEELLRRISRGTFGNISREIREWILLEIFGRTTGGILEEILECISFLGKSSKSFRMIPWNYFLGSLWKISWRNSCNP